VRFWCGLGVVVWLWGWLMCQSIVCMYVCMHVYVWCALAAALLSSFTALTPPPPQHTTYTYTNTQTHSILLPSAPLPVAERQPRDAQQQPVRDVIIIVYWLMVVRVEGFGGVWCIG
jgi:hypothetical protein